MPTPDPHALTPAEQRDILREWFDRKAATTIYSYRFSLAEFAKVVGAEFQTLDRWIVDQGPGGVTRALRRYKKELTTRKRPARGARGLAPASVNARLAAVASLVDALREARRIDWDIKVRGLKNTPYRDTRGPGVAAVRKLLDAAADQARPRPRAYGGRTVTNPKTGEPVVVPGDPKKAARDVAIVRLLFDLALRRRELCGITLADVERDESARPSAVYIVGKGQGDVFDPQFALDLTPAEIEALAADDPDDAGATVQHEESWADQHDSGTVVKTRLALGDRTAEALAAWLEYRAAAHPEQLFTAVAGRRRAGPLTPRSVAKVLERLGRAAGIGPVRPHGLRHSAITAALDAGHDVREVRRYSRHAKLETVLKYDDNRQDVAKKISGTVSDLV